MGKISRGQETTTTWYRFPPRPALSWVGDAPTCWKATTGEQTIFHSKWKIEIVSIFNKIQTVSAEDVNQESQKKKNKKKTPSPSLLTYRGDFSSQFIAGVHKGYLALSRVISIKSSIWGSEAHLQSVIVFLILIYPSSR